jgi:hypothetical protein
MVEIFALMACIGGVNNLPVFCNFANDPQLVIFHSLGDCEAKKRVYTTRNLGPDNVGILPGQRYACMRKLVQEQWQE